jgi:hypothetical protein
MVVIYISLEICTNELVVISWYYTTPEIPSVQQMRELRLSFENRLTN